MIRARSGPRARVGGWYRAVHLLTLYATTASPVLLLVQVRTVFGGLSARFATFFHSKISTCGGGAVWARSTWGFARGCDVDPEWEGGRRLGLGGQGGGGTLSGDRVGATGAAESVMLGRRRASGHNPEGAVAGVERGPEAKLLVTGVSSLGWGSASERSQGCRICETSHSTDADGGLCRGGAHSTALPRAQARAGRVLAHAKTCSRCACFCGGRRRSSSVERLERLPHRLRAQPWHPFGGHRLGV